MPISLLFLSLYVTQELNKYFIIISIFYFQMNQSACMFVRNREIYGQARPLLRKCIEMQTYFKHLYIHEIIYEHNQVDDVYFHLLQICSNGDKLKILYECWTHMKDDEDKSIIWLASTIRDCFLISAIDEIKCFTM